MPESKWHQLRCHSFRDGRLCFLFGCPSRADDSPCAKKLARAASLSFLLSGNFGSVRGETPTRTDLMNWQSWLAHGDGRRVRRVCPRIIRVADKRKTGHGKCLGSVVRTELLRLAVIHRANPTGVGRA